MDNNNFGAQPVYEQPAPAAPSGNGKRSLLFGILSIAVCVVGSIVSSAASSSVFGSYYIYRSEVVTAIVMCIIFGIVFNAAGIVFSVIATRNAGRPAVGKGLGGKITGIIGRVINILDLVASAVIIICLLVILATW